MKETSIYVDRKAIRRAIFKRRVNAMLDSGKMAVELMRYLLAKVMWNFIDPRSYFIQDQTVGHKWRLKRKLTNQDWMVIDERVTRNGEKLVEVLQYLNVLA